MIAIDDQHRCLVVGYCPPQGQSSGIRSAHQVLDVDEMKGTSCRDVRRSRDLPPRDGVQMTRALLRLDCVKCCWLDTVNTHHEESIA